MSVVEELGLPSLPEALPRPVIDNHTHTFYTHGRSKLPVEDNIALARQVGVTRIIEVGCDVASSQDAVGLAARHRDVVAAVAIHPNDAARLDAEGGADLLRQHIAQIEQLAAQPGVRAVGETGLDYYRTREESGHRAQELSFVEHIRIARERDLTLMIHDRDAHDDILRVLDDVGAPQRVVMHCFSGDADFAQQCVERGFWLSYPGVVTFGSAPELREAAAVTPLERILVETDAPYLTPKPERGKPNAPYLLPHTVRFLADLLDQDLAGFCDQIVANTFAAYGGAWGEP